MCKACNEILHGRRRRVLAFSDRCLCLCDSEFGGPRDPFISLTCLQNAVHLVDTPPRPKALDRPPRSLPQREIAGVPSLAFANFSCQFFFLPTAHPDSQTCILAFPWLSQYRAAPADGTLASTNRVNRPTWD